MATSFTLNGRPVEVGEHPHLLAALREELDVTSPKDGCSPSGQCGCCTVLVDGKAIVSCQQSLDKVAGREVIDARGLRAGERDRYANASPRAAARSAASASPASSCGPRPRSTRRAPSSNGRTWPAISAPTCAGAPAT